MPYGADIYGRPRLTNLVRGRAGIDDLKWIRLLYTYPTGWREDLIDLLAAEEKLCAYIDMPIQHASDSILNAMNRGTTRAAIRSTHSKVPGARTQPQYPDFGHRRIPRRGRKTRPQAV